MSLTTASSSGGTEPVTDDPEENRMKALTGTALERVAARSAIAQVLHRYARPVQPQSQAGAS